jgi:hypothetical protein
MQQKFNEIYDTIERMIEGKKKLLMGKWASRNIMNGTSNVITAMDTSVSSAISGIFPSPSWLFIGHCSSCQSDCSTFRPLASITPAVCWGRCQQ